MLDFHDEPKCRSIECGPLCQCKYIQCFELIVNWDRQVEKSKSWTHYTLHWAGSVSRVTRCSLLTVWHLRLYDESNC